MADVKTKKKRTSKAPEGETKAGKFSRLGTARLNTAIAKINLLKNLASPGYEFTAEQVATIRSHLQEAVSGVVKALEARLAGGSSSEKPSVTL